MKSDETVLRVGLSIGGLESLRGEVQEVLLRQVHFGQLASVRDRKRRVLSVEAVKVLTARRHPRLTLN